MAVPGDDGANGAPAHLAARLIAELRRQQLSIATAESITAGLVAATIAEVPGASTVLRGGLIVYATECKHTLAGVSMELLADDQVVSRRCSEQLAIGARTRCAADLGVSTTGVAGPDPQSGQPPGTVWIAVADHAGVTAQLLALTGERNRIRRDTVTAVFELALSRLASHLTI